MRKFLILMSVLFLFNPLNSSAVEVIRDGPVIVLKGACMAFNLDNLNASIPEGVSSIPELVGIYLASLRELTSEEVSICEKAPVDPVDPVDPVTLVWRVAKNGAVATRPAKILVLESDGTITRKTSKIRLPIGSACEQDSDYVLPSTGGREWRIPVGFSDLAIICEQVEVADPVVPITDFSAGFNFRKTAGYITDSSGNEFAGSESLYSDTVGFGWVGTAPNFRNRANSVPPELAGIAYADNNGTQYTFRIDLPAPGSYDVRLAIGDMLWPQENVFVQVFDGDNPIIQTMDGNGYSTAKGAFIDAAGIMRETPETWAENNEPFVYDFQTSIMRVVLGAPTAIGRMSVISHISVSTSN